MLTGNVCLENLELKEEIFVCTSYIGLDLLKPARTEFHFIA